MSKQKKNIKAIVKIETKENPLYNYILIASFFLFLVLLTTFKISGDDDVFWHLATGRFIVENKFVPDKDVFGITSAATVWVPFEWGWDVISYLIYCLGGNIALSIFS